MGKWVTYKNCWRTLFENSKGDILCPGTYKIKNIKPVKDSRSDDCVGFIKGHNYLCLNMQQRGFYFYDISHVPESDIKEYMEIIGHIKILDPDGDELYGEVEEMDRNLTFYYNLTDSPYYNKNVYDGYDIIEKMIKEQPVNITLGDDSEGSLGYDKYVIHTFDEIKVCESMDVWIENFDYITQDFICNINESPNFTVECDYDNIDEFYSSSYTGNIKQDTIKIVTRGEKLPIIQITKTETDEVIFLVDITTSDRHEFRNKAYMKTKEEFNQLLNETIDMLNSSPQLSKYAMELKEFTH